MTESKITTLQQEFADLKLLVIDEIGMVPPAVLALVDYSLKVATGRAEPWGGVQVVVAGDFRQLPPVRSVSLYGPASSNDTDIVALAKRLWKSIDSVVVLKEIMRVTDPEIQQLNLRARSGNITEQDAQLLSTRIISETQLDAMQLDALWTYPTKAQRDARNARFLELHGTTVFVWAQHAMLGALLGTSRRQPQATDKEERMRLLNITRNQQVALLVTSRQ